MIKIIETSEIKKSIRENFEEDFIQQNLTKQGLVDYIRSRDYTKFNITFSNPYTGHQVDKNGEFVPYGVDLGYMSLDELINFLDNRNNSYSPRNRTIKLIGTSLATYSSGSSRSNHVYIHMKN